ncbi:POK9 protein, partial [Chloroceryle aenea]|nr:POK9 protein [Chloroceryle aenea]
AGSAGMDMETAVGMTLMDSSVKCIESNMRGPLGCGISALLLGRSSMSRQGIFVLPGVIDADFTGIIKIMVYTPTPPASIPAGSKIAQLVPFKAKVPNIGNKTHGDAGFGSTGSPEVLLVLGIKKGKPEEMVKITGPGNDYIMLGMIVDTGTDVTII